MSALRSKGQKQKEAIKDPNDSEEPIIKKVESETAVLEMKQMFTEFMRANHENQLQTRFEIEELKKSISSINKPTTPRSEKVPFFDELSDNRKSSIFFGSPLQSEAENNSRRIRSTQHPTTQRKLATCFKPYIPSTLERIHLRFRYMGTMGRAQTPNTPAYVSPYHWALESHSYHKHTQLKITFDK
jgi:hypothetical protein